MFGAQRKHASQSLGLLFVLLVLGSGQVASAQPWYLNVYGTQGDTKWYESLGTSPGLVWYSGNNRCLAYNSNLQWLFATTAGLGMDVDATSGAIQGVFMPPETTAISDLARSNASGAWWQVYAGPFSAVVSGTSAGLEYRERRTYTGYAEYQVQGTGGFWAMPALLQRYWLTQAVQIESDGSGMASCSGSGSAPAGCQQCN
jgi:hypothetical protein